MQSHFIFKNLHLLLSTIIVTVVAFVYGFQPQLLFNVTIKTTDEANIFTAIMGLYLGFSLLWIVGILKPAFWKAATLSNMIFMLGLAFGRFVSVFFDGIPSIVFVLGTIGELTLGFYAWYQLKQERASIEAL
jgi:hypothetical protein